MHTFIARRVADSLATLLPLFVVALLAGCDGSGQVNLGVDNPPADPRKSIAITPELLWLVNPANTAQLTVFEVHTDGTRIDISAAASYLSLDSAVATVNATGLVTAVAAGRTTIRAGRNGLFNTITVSVGPDYWSVEGYASPGGTVNLRTVTSNTLDIADTGLTPSSDDGVTNVARLGDELFVVSNMRVAQGSDRIDRFNLNTRQLTGQLNLGTNCFAQSILIISPTKAYVVHQDPDGVGHFVSVFSPRDMVLLGRISLPNPTPEPLKCISMAAYQNLLFISNSAWTFVPTFHYVVGNINVVDMDTDTVIDTIPGGAYDLIALTASARNCSRVTISPRGKLYAVCAGNFFAGETGLLEVFHPLTFAREATLDFGADGFGGDIDWAPNGVLYIANQYQPNLLTVNGLTDALIRDGANRLILDNTPGLFSGHSQVRITPEGRLITGATGVTASQQPRYFAFNIADDTGSGSVANLTLSILRPAFSGNEPGSAALRRDSVATAFCDAVVSYTNPATVNNDPLKALGAPQGGGSGIASSDVVRIGTGGSLVLRFTNRRIEDRAGFDFVVFSNATFRPGAPGLRHLFRNMRPGRVEVSQDGLNWIVFPATENPAFSINDVQRYEGGWCGLTPTWSSSGSGIDPASWAAGGDRFDLATVGLAWAKYVRISGDDCEVDAVAALHSTQD